MQKMTIESRYFRRLQRIHAQAIIIAPLVGAVLAVVEILRSGISSLNITILLVMYFLTMLGISVGFHRYLSHHSFQAGRSVRAILTILGSMAAQGSPIYWISNHRRHHQFSDRPGDLHSPYLKDDSSLDTFHGFWH